MRNLAKRAVKGALRRAGFDLVRYRPPVIRDNAAPAAAAAVAVQGAAQADQERSVSIGGKIYRISSDDEYLQGVGAEFEPQTIRLFDSLVSPEDYALDVGANIGCTALALADRCAKVVAFEPAPATFAFLERNVANSGLENLEIRNCALGSAEGISQITYATTNRSGAFVSDKTKVSQWHTTEEIVIHRLDDLMPALAIPHVDFMKLDVEGFEASVIEGARDTIERFKPVVALELNHWCLNAFQRTSVPDFLDFLRSVFPVLLAVHGDRYADLRDNDEAYMVMYRHIVHFEYSSIVAGFDRERLTAFYRQYHP